jgi:hypothetical protein
MQYDEAVSLHAYLATYVYFYMMHYIYIYIMYVYYLASYFQAFKDGVTPERLFEETRFLISHMGHEFVCPNKITPDTVKDTVEYMVRVIDIMQEIINML